MTGDLAVCGLAILFFGQFIERAESVCDHRRADAWGMAAGRLLAEWDALYDGQGGLRGFSTEASN